MVFYEHDILDERYTDADLDKYNVYFGSVKLTTDNRVYECDSCCLRIKREIYGITLRDGTELDIPVSDVISLEETLCGA